MEKTAEYYLALPYTIELIPEPAGGWFVGVKELPGCISEGDTPEEAIEMIRDAMRGWIEISLEDGDPIPEPRDLEDFSGKFVVRVPRSLHRELVESAEREGVSLNQYINVTLARGAGRPASSSPQTTGEPCWSMLKSGVRRALLVAGLSEEAGELDERLFADLVERKLGEVEIALGRGYYRDAKWALAELADTLRPSASKSPVLAMFHRLADFLCSQVEPIAQWQQGIVDEAMITRRAGQTVEGSALARQMTREAQAAYAASTVGPLYPGRAAENPLERHVMGLPVGEERYESSAKEDSSP